MEQTQTTEELLKALAEIETEEKTLELNRVELYMRKGKILLQLKEQLPHGEFLPRLKSAKLNTNPRQAQRMMELAANEDLIKANTTDLSHLLTLERAFALIGKHKKKSEQREAAPLKVVSQSEVSTTFNSEQQVYNVMVKIKAKDMKWMQCKTNQLSVTKAIKQALEKILEARSLTDMTTMVPN